MFKCECCSILIDSDEQPLKCPRCPNMENFSLIDAASEKLPLPDDDGLMTLVCSHCEDSVKVPDTTGTCPRCGKDSVFVNIPPVPLDPNLKPHEGAASAGELEPTSEKLHTGIIEKVEDKIAERPVIVDPGNVLVNDTKPEGFNAASTGELEPTSEKLHTGIIEKVEDKIAERPVIVDPDNVLTNDTKPEGFNNATEPDPAYKAADPVK